MELTNQTTSMSSDLSPSLMLHHLERKKCYALAFSYLVGRWGWCKDWCWGSDGRRVGNWHWCSNRHVGHDWLRAKHGRVVGVLDDWRGDHVVVGNGVANLGGVGLRECRWGWVNDWGADGGGWGRYWKWGRGGHGDWCGDWHWNGCWCNNWRSVGMHWGIMTDVRSEGVAVQVRRLADHLVAHLLVANDGSSGLHSLEDGGGRGDRVDGGRLGHQSLAVDGGQGGHGRQGGHGNGSGRNCLSGFFGS